MIRPTSPSPTILPASTLDRTCSTDTSGSRNTNASCATPKIGCRGSEIALLCSCNPSLGYETLIDTLTLSVNELISCITKLFQSLMTGTGTSQVPNGAPTSTPSNSTNAGNTSSATNSSGSATSAGSATAAVDNLSQEFLWKPVSEKDGRLAILIPAHLTGDVASVQICDKQGKVLAKGRYANVGNGGREHYRFTKKGSSFPDGSVVNIKLNDSTQLRVTIPHTKDRIARKMR